jgi:hypothetical protein
LTKINDQLARNVVTLKRSAGSKNLSNKDTLSFWSYVMKVAIYLVTIIVFGITQVPAEALAKRPPTPPPANIQDSMPEMPPPPSMREGTRVTPLKK